MLKKLGEDKRKVLAKPISKCQFPSPFEAGLEYSSPARGTWNIVHTGMLIPQCHEIFVCAYGCLRGVVLTAAEMNALDRYSAISIQEENVLYGGMEELMIEGVSDIISKLEREPKAILLFISCHHFFLAYDQEMVFETLKERFPQIRFTDSYMIPTLRKSGITPDQRMRIQLYRFLEESKEKAPNRINFIGSNHSIDSDSELLGWLTREGFDVWDLPRCKTFEEYLEMSKSSINIYYEPLAHMAAKDMEERLSIPSCYLSFSFQEEELDRGYQKLAKALHIDAPDFSEEKKQMRQALLATKELVKETPFALDYTFTFKTLSFAKLLLDNGFCLERIYVDAFVEEERDLFEEIKEDYPSLAILPTNQPAMRFCHEDAQGKVIALGEKAAYFEGTNHFVQVVESGGYFGYQGIVKICQMIQEAYLVEKERKTRIQRKGFRCESCL